jgi:hypothetical protein
MEALRGGKTRLGMAADHAIALLWRQRTSRFELAERTSRFELAERTSRFELAERTSRFEF